jgi:hypothetical protein
LPRKIETKSWYRPWLLSLSLPIGRAQEPVLLVRLRLLARIALAELHSGAWQGEEVHQQKLLRLMIDENVARREVETTEWSVDVGAGSQATAAAEMQRWA